MTAAHGPSVEIDAEDGLRADFYDLLSALLARAPSAELLRKLADLSGDTGALGSAITALARVARSTGPSEAEREYNRLFIGMGRGELLPFASYYMTGFLNEKPLAVLRTDMARLSIARADTVFEPEDNIASLCDMMAGLIRGRFGAPASLATQKDFFSAHIAPWAGHFFKDLEGAEGSVLFAPVGAAGAAFIDIEREAFRLGG